MATLLDYDIDNTDMKIISILKDNSRTKYVNIAKRTGMSEGAVRYRVKRLVEKNIIKNFTLETVMDEPEAVLLLRIDPLISEKAIKKLKKQPYPLYETSGEWDAAILLRVSDSYELNHIVDKIRGIGGIIETQTLLKMV